MIMFYQQAKARQHHSPSPRKVNLDGMQLEERLLPGCPVRPGPDESALAITSPDPRETRAVQIIVSPRTSGGFLDPSEPSAEILRERQADLQSALQTHQYIAVYLLDR